MVNGSMEESVWGTAEAIPASLNKSWPQILNSFNKPATGENTGGGGYSADPITTTTSTPITTSTLNIPNIDTPTSTTPLILGEKITQETKIISIPTPTTDKLSEAKPKTNNFPPKADQPRAETIQQYNNATIQQLNNKSEPVKETYPNKTTQLINSLPLDTPTRHAAKKVAAVTGGSAVAVGLYLGFRLLKNVI